ncbi:MAG: ABC transporter substrate-binding protein [Propionibacteriaceae bacterium]|nr:ABC transporter substrate-binding protein [Propionibacteriaceae bacterium]
MKLNRPTGVAIGKLVLAGLACLSLVGCAAGSTGQSASPSSPTSDTYTFTDDVGRQVQLPTDIQRIAPSGPMAQLVLFALCPDKLVGLASMFSDSQFQYLDQKYQSLPVFGNFYSNTLNLESVLNANPQVVIDIGDVKPSSVADLDGIQAKTGIPTVFVKMDSLDAMVSAYQTLGQVTGDQDQAEALGNYISQTLADVQQKVATIPESSRPSVFYGQNDGLTAAVAGTTHTAVIDAVGATNVAQIPSGAGAGTASISMEQLMVWQPDIILLAPGTAFGSVGSDPAWQGLDAIKSGRYYEIPDGPYNWIDSPPSINQVLGIVWLANLLYPDVFSYDMVQRTQEFYQLFYHCNVTQAQVNQLLANSTLKQ